MMMSIDYTAFATIDTTYAKRDLMSHNTSLSCEPYSDVIQFADYVQQVICPFLSLDERIHEITDKT